jgi:hypothetical protein
MPKVKKVTERTEQTELKELTEQTAQAEQTGLKELKEREKVMPLTPVGEALIRKIVKLVENIPEDVHEKFGVQMAVDTLNRLMKIVPYYMFFPLNDHGRQVIDDGKSEAGK